MRYCVALTNAQYGNAYVEAESQEEAKQKARDLYDKRRIDWYEDELLDLDPQPEEYPVDGVRCRRCGGRLFKSAVPGYVYQCYECDEDFYSFEAVIEEARQ